MIRITVWRVADGRYGRLRVEGHANAGQYGEDVVCAGVSALVETLALAWQHTAAHAGSVRIEMGSADFRLTDGSQAEEAIAMRVIVEGLEDLAKTHARYVRWQEQRASD